MRSQFTLCTISFVCKNNIVRIVVTVDVSEYLYILPLYPLNFLGLFAQSRYYIPSSNIGD